MKNSRDKRQDSTSIFPVLWSENDKTKEVEFSTEKIKYWLFLPGYKWTIKQLAKVWILKYFNKLLGLIVMLITVICATFSWYAYVCQPWTPRAIIMTIDKNTERWTGLLSLLFQRLN